MCLHSPNRSGQERMLLFEMEDEDGHLHIRNERPETGCTISIPRTAGISGRWRRRHLRRCHSIRRGGSLFVQNISGQRNITSSRPPADFPSPASTGGDLPQSGNERFYENKRPNDSLPWTPHPPEKARAVRSEAGMPPADVHW